MPVVFEIGWKYGNIETRNPGGRGKETKMKRIGILLLALAVLASCFSFAAADEGTLVYASTFVAGTDGWYARGAKRTYRTTEGTVRTEGRSSDWHSPGRDFQLIDGADYKLSVEVYQDTADSANFMISIAHTRDGSETYENAATAVMKQIDSGYPVPILNLNHKEKAFKDYEWHWFLINGYEETNNTLFVKAVTYSGFQWLDFRKLWDTGFANKGGLILYSLKGGRTHED